MSKGNLTYWMPTFVTSSLLYMKYKPVVIDSYLFNKCLHLEYGHPILIIVLEVLVCCNYNIMLLLDLLPLQLGESKSKLRGSRQFEILCSCPLGFVREQPPVFTQ